MKLIAKAGIAALAAGAVLAVPGISSAAATGHPISGTCYESGAVFVSSNVRTMGSSYIKVGSWSSTPTNGIRFGVQNYNSGGGMGQIYAPPTGTQTITSGRSAGTQFVNYFALQNPGHQSNYSFSASETY